jgi:uncharacterized cupin superfamily protein
MVFHYHLQREELLVVIRGTLALRTASGWRELAEGDVIAFPRGERGAHGYENRSDAPIRILMISEQNAPNVSVYPDTNQIGIFRRGSSSLAEVWRAFRRRGSRLRLRARPRRDRASGRAVGTRVAE